MNEVSGRLEQQLGSTEEVGTAAITAAELLHAVHTGPHQSTAPPGKPSLAMKELRRPLPEEREPARQRQPPGAQLRRRELLGD
jgi:hypothetical protein